MIFLHHKAKHVRHPLPAEFFRLAQVVPQPLSRY